jgi:hypothetical protein
MFVIKRRSIDKFVKPVKAREFCRLWFNADAQMEATRAIERNVFAC